MKSTKILGVLLMEVLPCPVGSLNHLVLVIMLWLGRRRSARCLTSEAAPGGNDVLFEEDLADKFFQILSEASAMDGLVPLTVMVRIIFFHSVEHRIILDWLWAPYPWLVLDGVEDFIDGEP